MDMSVSGGSFWQKLFSGKGVTAVSHSFVMDWASVWVDIVLGLLIAGAASAWVPESFWRTFFLSNNPTWLLSTLGAYPSHCYERVCSAEQANTSAKQRIVVPIS